MTNTKKPTLHRVPVYRRPIFLIVAAILICAAIAVFIVLHKNSTQAPSDPSRDSSTVQPSSSTDKVDLPTTDDPEEPEKITQFEGGDPNELEELTGSIAYHGITGDTLTITASIDQFLSEAGNCKLQLSQNGQLVYSAELPAKADVTTSVCGPFEIPTQNLYSGTYQIRIEVTGNDKFGTIIGETTI